MVSTAYPQLAVLNPSQVESVNDAAVSVLQRSGIRVDSPHAQNVFKKTDGARVDNDRVFLSREIVEWAIQSSPEKIDLFRRDGGQAFSLDSQASQGPIFGVGVTNLYYQEALTDNVVPFSRDHMTAATLLGDALDEFDTVATPGVIQDVANDQAEMIGALEMLANTKKPIVLLVSDTDTFASVVDMYTELAGLTDKKPFVLPYLNPITPLVFNTETTQKLDIAISRGLPVIFSNYGMSGATTPITPGPTLVLLTAELLAGLVYCQLKQPGTAVILGSLPASFDMKSMASYYTPQSMLLNLACAEMMSHYGIPHCGTSGGWMGWGTDLMASSMLWANHLSGGLGKVGLIPFVGNNFDSLAFSPSTVVFAAEIIRFIRAFGQGLTLDGEDLGVEEIVDLGPGANYLTSPSTMKHFRQLSTLSEIWPTLSLEKWNAQGRPDAGRILREHTHRLIHESRPPEDRDDVLAAGEAFICRKG